jgi:spermidine synthase
MFVGTTTLALAILPEVKEVVTLEYEPYLLEFAAPFFEKHHVRSKIDARIGDARESIKQLAKEGKKFDVVRPRRDSAFAHCRQACRPSSTPTSLTIQLISR